MNKILWNVLMSAKILLFGGKNAKNESKIFLLKNFLGFRFFFMVELCEWKIYVFFGFQAIIWEKCFLINLECRHVCITIPISLSLFFFFFGLLFLVKTIETPLHADDDDDEIVSHKIMMTRRFFIIISKGIGIAKELHVNFIKSFKYTWDSRSIGVCKA